MTDRALELAAPETARSWVRRPASYWGGVATRLARDPVTLICAAILMAIVVIVIFAPLLGLDDPYQQSVVRRLKPPGTPGHLLGTDELGRDLLARLVYGGRTSLVMGFLPVFIATLVGGTLGVVAGYAGGLINTAVMRTMDVFYAFPSVLLAVAISGVLGGGVRNGLLALTLVFIPSIARVSESITMHVSTQDFVDAARATGAYPHQILVGHVLKNVVAPILVFSSSLISISIVIAAGLSFLGLGIAPPIPEWGLMLSTLRPAIYVAPLNAVLPGVMIFVTSMCFNMMSDGFRNAMDVKV